MATLIRGDKLNEAQRKEVLAAYGYRWTIENKERATQWMGKDKVPTCMVTTDKNWLQEHAFYVLKNGSLSHSHKRCEPACLADWVDGIKLGAGMEWRS